MSCAQHLSTSRSSRSSALRRACSSSGGTPPRSSCYGRWPTWRGAGSRPLHSPPSRIATGMRRRCAGRERRRRGDVRLHGALLLAVSAACAAARDQQCARPGRCSSPALLLPHQRVYRPPGWEHCRRSKPTLQEAGGGRSAASGCARAVQPSPRAWLPAARSARAGRRLMRYVTPSVLICCVLSRRARRCRQMQRVRARSARSRRSLRRRRQAAQAVGARRAECAADAAAPALGAPTAPRCAPPRSQRHRSPLPRLSRRAPTQRVALDRAANRAPPPTI